MADGKPTLLHLDYSQSQQILWLLEELGIEYNLKFFERVKQRAPESLKETHPLGKSPQLITPEGRVIIERAAIALYLIERYDTAGKFKINSNDPENDAIKEEEWMSFGGSSLNPVLMLKLVFKMLRDMSPFFVRPLMGGIGSVVDKGFISKEMESMLKYLDDGLAGKQWFMNTENPTKVDFCMLWYVDFLTIGGTDYAKYENIKAWIVRCKARDAWKRSIEKGNGYELP